MNPILLDDGMVRLVESWLWPFFRVAGLMMSAPVIGTRSVPVKVRLVIAIAVSLVLIPVVPPYAYIDPFTLPGVLVSIQQVIIGVAMGFAVRVVFIVLELAGQMIGQLMGLMMASMVDPTNGSQVPMIGQFYLLLATLLFLSVDGHLIMIGALAESFILLPISTSGVSRSAVWTLLGWTSTILSTSVLIALPAIASLLIVNISFGVMTRSAPQLNIFAVGFPIMIILGILIILVTLDGFVPHMLALFEESFAMTRVLTGG